MMIPGPGGGPQRPGKASQGGAVAERCRLSVCGHAQAGAQAGWPAALGRPPRAPPTHARAGKPDRCAGGGRGACRSVAGFASAPAAAAGGAATPEASVSLSAPAGLCGCDTTSRPRPPGHGSGASHRSPGPPWPAEGARGAA